MYVGRPGYYWTLQLSHRAMMPAPPLSLPRLGMAGHPWAPLASTPLAPSCDPPPHHRPLCTHKEKTLLGVRCLSPSSSQHRHARNRQHRHVRRHYKPQLPRSFTSPCLPPPSRSPTHARHVPTRPEHPGRRDTVSYCHHLGLPCARMAGRPQDVSVRTTSSPGCG